MLLQSSLIRTEADLAVSKLTSSHLRKELDRQEQYSARNCLVFDGIKASSLNDDPNDHIEIIEKKLTMTIKSTPGWTKRIPFGPVRDDEKQSFIV